MIRVDAARKIILENISPIKEAETLNFISSFNRISAQAIKAKENIPPFNNSAMDGFAIRARDLVGASRESPKILEVVEDLPAGYAAKKSVKSGQAIRIMTGAPLPRGADAVVMVEETKQGRHCERAVGERSNLKKGLLRRPFGPPRNDTVEIYKEVKPGENVRYAGEDVKKGEVVIKKGTRLRAGHIGMLASLGVSKVKVFRRPKVAVLATGDELVNVDEKLKPGKIRNSNTYSLYSQVLKAGAVPIILGIARDKKAELEKKIRKGITSDMLLVSGGVSVGDYDFVKLVLKKLGTEMNAVRNAKEATQSSKISNGMKFWKVAMRPGKPLAFGVIRKTPVFGLPGNPVSSMVSFELFVRAAILKMMGKGIDKKTEVGAQIEEALSKKKGLRYFLRANTYWRDGTYRTRTTGPQGSGVLKSMVLANSLIVLPEDKEFIKKGEKVPVIFM